MEKKRYKQLVSDKPNSATVMHFKTRFWDAFSDLCPQMLLVSVLCIHTPRTCSWFPAVFITKVASFHRDSLTERKFDYARLIT